MSGRDAVYTIDVPDAAAGPRPAPRLWDVVDSGSPHAPAFLPGRLWVAVLVLYLILAVLEPYDLLSPISGYGLQEHKAEIGAALDTIESGSMLRRVGVLALCLYGAAAVFVSRRGHRRYHLAIAVPATALFFLAMASPLWSDDPAITIRKVVVLFALVLAAFGLARCWGFDTISRVAFVLSGLTIVLGVTAEVVLGTMHPLRPDYRFRGSIHPNSMGLYCTLFVISSVVLAKRFAGRRSALMAALSVIGLGMLLLTKSRGSLIGVCAALGVMFVSSASRRTVLLAAAAVAVVVCGAAIAVPDLAGRAQSWATLGRPTTFELSEMTGRTELFQDLLPYVADRPVLGYGYDSFWQPVHILEVARSQGWVVGSSHNQLMGMLLDLGIAGTALFVLLLAAGLWSSIRYLRRERRATALFPIAILLSSYVNMVTFGFWFETTVPSLIALTVLARLAIRDTGGSWASSGGWVRHAFE
jgi:exopolysaccharide production protein ExoQ